MILTGSKVFLRFLEEKDAEALYDLHLRNKEFFQVYSPTRNSDFYTLESKCKFIEDCIRQRESDERYSFGIFTNDTDELIGSINLNEVLRGPSQSCLIGYSMDKLHNGKGYTTEAVHLAVQFAFDNLRLHRIEAGVMQRNIGSMRVLEKVGFNKEGIAQKNVRINGKWEDHQMLAIISDKD